jgi:hypothetical protein
LLIADSCSLADQMAPSPARLIVERTSRDDVQTRQIILSLDGDPWTTLLYGESASCGIAPGKHRLRAYNTLVWRTVEFDVAPGESVRFSAVNRAGRGTAALIALLGVGPLYVTLERLPDPS